MKSTHALFLLSAGLFFGCASQGPRPEIFNLPSKGPAQAEGKILKNELKGGLSSLKGKKVHAFVIFNLPDGYLIRAKSKINPPDYAIKEVVDLQEERVSWLNEALVVNCDQCFDLHAEPPLRELSEDDLLRLIDKVSLHQAPVAADWKTLQKESGKADYIWLIFGSEDYEQRRGPVKKNGVLSAWSQIEVTLKSYLYDRAKGKVIHASEVVAKDFDLAVYPLPTEMQDKQTALAVTKLSTLDDLSALEPEGSGFDSTQFDNQYPYPDVPDSPNVVQKGLLKMLELANQ